MLYQRQESSYFQELGHQGRLLEGKSPKPVYVKIKTLLANTERTKANVLVIGN